MNKRVAFGRHHGEAGKSVWEAKCVSEIATHSLGKMLDKAKNVGSFRPYLRNLNVRWFEFDLSDLSEMRFRDEELERYTVKKGDLVICEGGYPGRAAIWDADEPIHFQKALHRVRFPEPERAKWLLYYLSFMDASGKLKDHFNGAGIQHFTGEALARFKLPVPPLAEQRRIVGILDEAFAELEAMRANVQASQINVEVVFEAEMDAALREPNEDARECCLGDICTIASALIDPKLEEFQDRLHVGAGNIIANGGGLINLQTARNEGLISGKFEFDERMVLYSKIRPYLRKIVLPDFSGICSADIYPLKPTKQISREYLYYELLSRRFTKYAESVSARAGMPKVNRDDLFRYKFLIPSMEHQHDSMAVSDRTRANSIVIRKLCGKARRTRRTPPIASPPSLFRKPLAHARRAAIPALRNSGQAHADGVPVRGHGQISGNL